ncbi:hypothetical protein BHE74_00004652 [Ensete ventricosum]|nr:hypothetical protein BHE74_00004652 [Ensete ventricosum]
MGGIDLFKQGCVWVQFQKQDFVSGRVAASHAVEKLMTLIDRHWPLVYSWCTMVAMFLFRLLLRWRGCVARGLRSLFTLEQKESKQVMEDFSVDGEYTPPTKEAEDAVYSKSFSTTSNASNLSNTKKDASSSKVVIMEPTSLVEMERIMNSSNHYEGMTCRPNTHGPTFHVNMVALDSTGLGSDSSTYSWGLDAKMVVEDDEFELWLQEAVASGIFSETPKRRKSWPFKINQKGLKPWRRSP